MGHEAIDGGFSQVNSTKMGSRFDNPQSERVNRAGVSIMTSRSHAEALRASQASGFTNGL